MAQRALISSFCPVCALLSPGHHLRLQTTGRDRPRAQQFFREVHVSLVKLHLQANSTKCNLYSLASHVHHVGEQNMHMIMASMCLQEGRLPFRLRA